MALQYTKEYMATDNMKQNKHLPYKELVSNHQDRVWDVENEVRTYAGYVEDKQQWSMKLSQSEATALDEE